MIILTETGSGAEGTRFLNPDHIETIESLAGDTVVVTTSGRLHHVKESKSDVAKMIALHRKGNPQSYAVHYFGEAKWIR